MLDEDVSMWSEISERGATAMHTIVLINDSSNEGQWLSWARMVRGLRGLFVQCTNGYPRGQTAADEGHYDVDRTAIESSLPFYYFSRKEQRPAHAQRPGILN